MYSTLSTGSSFSQKFPVVEDNSFRLSDIRDSSKCYMWFLDGIWHGLFWANCWKCFQRIAETQTAALCVKNVWTHVSCWKCFQRSFSNLLKPKNHFLCCETHCFADAAGTQAKTWECVIKVFSLSVTIGHLSATCLPLFVHDQSPVACLCWQSACTEIWKVHVKNFVGCLCSQSVVDFLLWLIDCGQQVANEWLMSDRSSLTKPFRQFGGVSLPLFDPLDEFIHAHWLTLSPQLEETVVSVVIGAATVMVVGNFTMFCCLFCRGFGWWRKCCRLVSALKLKVKLWWQTDGSVTCFQTLHAHDTSNQAQWMIQTATKVLIWKCFHATHTVFDAMIAHTKCIFVWESRQKNESRHRATQPTVLWHKKWVLQVGKSCGNRVWQPKPLLNKHSCFAAPHLTEGTTKLKFLSQLLIHLSNTWTSLHQHSQLKMQFLATHCKKGNGDFFVIFCVVFCWSLAHKIQQWKISWPLICSWVLSWHQLPQEEVTKSAQFRNSTVRRDCPHNFVSREDQTTSDPEEPIISQTKGKPSMGGGQRQRETNIAIERKRDKVQKNLEGKDWLTTKTKELKNWLIFLLHKEVYRNFVVTHFSLPWHQTIGKDT